MSDLSSTDRVHAPLGKRGAFEGVARRHGRRRNPARRPPPSSLRTLTNQPRHSTQRWVEKCDRSVANSETPQLAGDAGQAAVAIESGKRKTACFRWGCNKRLRASFSRLADSTRHWHPWAGDLYAAARARGHDHPARTTHPRPCLEPHRMAVLARPRAIDPARHRALQRHVSVTVPYIVDPLPDPAATQRMAGDAVTRMAARRAEREALDRKPTSAIASGADTGRLLSRAA